VTENGGLDLEKISVYAVSIVLGLILVFGTAVALPSFVWNMAG